MNPESYTKYFLDFIMQKVQSDIINKINMKIENIKYKGLCKVFCEWELKGEL